MLALLTARPSLNSSTPLSIVVLLALLACAPLLGMSQADIEPIEPTPVPNTEIDESQPAELQQVEGTAISKSSWDCFEVMTPYGLKFADGSELTVEWGLEQMQHKIEAEYPGEIPVGYVFPLTVEYIDGTSELISSQETMEARINSCNNE